MHHHFRVACAMLAVLSCVSNGRAEATPSTPPLATDRYAYQFTDDLLTAGGLDVSGVHLRVASHIIRTTLIRPRTAFIAEMLKTVENL